MMRYGKTLVMCGALAALATSGREARATFLVQVTATLSMTGPNSSSVTYTVGQSSVTLTSNPAITDVDLSGNAPVHDAFASTSVQSTNTTGADTFTAAGTGYRWTLTFTHVNIVNIVNSAAVAEGASATASVGGNLSGAVSAYGSTLNNTYTSGPLTAPQALTIDGLTVYVMLDAYTPPGSPPTTTLNFSIGLSKDSGGFFAPAPEPGTIVLMGIGGGLLVLAPRLRRMPKPAA